MDAYVMLLWFVAGIALGWLIEFYIDWRFWRRTVLSAESTHVADSNELAALRKKIKQYEARIEELESDAEQANLATKSAEPSTDSASVGNLSTQDQPSETEATEPIDKDATGKHVGPATVTE